MESVGRLAGGVAHDFNNLLGIIMGYAEIIMMDMEPDNPVYSHLQQILNTTQKAAELTRQLLAFARKQTAIPKILDMNETVANMLKMLQRIISENIDLIWRPGYDIWKVRIDPVQIDQILANMTVNSRDAIPDTGSIVLETGNVVFDCAYTAGHTEFLPGEYVLLSVSDTGVGMSKEVMEHIFEPFFTTKETGKGTGLGLATVYGIVRQNSGFLNVYSEEGKGTTFKIYLPRFKSDIVQSTVEKVSGKPQRGTETLLIVENEEDYLMSCKMLLEKLGYTVLTATTPDDAIHIAEEHPGNIDLLITDVIMPKMNGKELLGNIRNIRPGLKYLYMSGYTADVIAHHGVLEEGVNFLQKPFSIKTIAEKVREVLDSK
jgi:CheY-like chemotaxis protein